CAARGRVEGAAAAISGSHRLRSGRAHRRRIRIHLCPGQPDRRHCPPKWNFVDLDRVRRRTAAYRPGCRLCIAGESKADRPALSGNAGGIEERPTMAEISRKDRAAIKSDIALSRDRIARELSGLRYELDIPRKLKNSFRDQTAMVGLLIAVAPARKKRSTFVGKATLREAAKACWRQERSLAS